MLNRGVGGGLTTHELNVSAGIAIKLAAKMPFVKSRVFS